MDDGADLAYRAWAPSAPSRRAVLLFHRGHEHSGRLRELAEALADGGRWVFAWDMRGHGASDGRGSELAFERLVADAEVFARGLEARHGIALSETSVVAHSLGALVAAAWTHDCAPPLQALVLATPAFRIRLFVPLAWPALRLLRRIAPRTRVRSFVSGRLLSTDAEAARSYESDPLVDRSIPLGLLLQSREAGRRLLADPAAIRVPTLVISAGRDVVVGSAEQRRFAAGVGSGLKRHVRLLGLRHGLFQEKDRELVTLLVQGFLAEAAQHPRESDPHALAEAEEERTAAGAEKLRAALPAWSPRRWQAAIARRFLRSLGRLSEGVRIGRASGFDSGLALDHVYENRARGRGRLGRLIDRGYLDSPGWRGIRERRTLVKQALAKCLASRPEAHLVDVAAGPGRYLQEALREHPQATALLRDQGLANVEAGRALAEQWGLSERVRCDSGDAFDESSLAELDPGPDVAIVSGLLELFGDDRLARRNLRGLARAVAPGGFLVYTNQPWHPQVAFIARVLDNHLGEPWVMRCRSQVEMDALVAEAGFEKLETRATSRGIFTVSIARRRSAADNRDAAPPASAAGVCSATSRRPPGARKWI
jgi:alpha-beta hydrolase superfamily lysophospholipase/SAM-dependent methyltransferase